MKSRCLQVYVHSVDTGTSGNHNKSWSKFRQSIKKKRLFKVLVNLYYRDFKLTKFFDDLSEENTPLVLYTDFAQISLSSEVEILSSRHSGMLTGNGQK